MNSMKIAIRKILKNLVNLINNITLVLKCFFEGLKDLLHMNVIIPQLVMQFDKFVSSSSKKDLQDLFDFILVENMLKSCEIFKFL